MRRILVVAVVMLALMVGSPSAAGATDVVVWMWTAHTTEPYQAWYKDFARRYENENPGATLRFEFVQLGLEKLLTAVVGRAPPDVAIVSVSYARDLYEAGALTVLNDFVQRTPHMTLENFVPAATIFNQKDGQIYGIPWSMEAESILYNRDHMRAAGLDDRPESLGTWDDLMNASRHLTQRGADGSITRSGYQTNWIVSWFTSYLYSNGGAFYSPDGNAVAFNSPEGIEALSFMYEMHSQYRAPGISGRAITDGTASLVHWSTSSITSLHAATPDLVDWMGQAPIPRGPRGDQAGGVGWSNMFVIPHGAANPELAWRFIAQWLEPQSQVAFFETFGGIDARSPRLDFYQTASFSDSVNRYFHLAQVPRIFISAKPYPHIRFTEISAHFNPLLSEVQKGALSPQAALEEAARLANTELAD